MASTTLSEPLTQEGGTTRTLPRSPGQLAWRRFRNHKAALISLGGIFLMLAYIWFGGLIFARGMCEPIGKFVTAEKFANCNDTSIKLQPPSGAHPFGTDTIGRDILARTIYGGQISLTIGLLAAIVEVGVGVVVGSVAGYFLSLIHI